jgi:hypothetical protein
MILSVIIVLFLLRQEKDLGQVRLETTENNIGYTI